MVIVRAASWCLLIAPAVLVAQTNAADSVRFLDAGWAYAYKSHDTTFAKRLFAANLIVTSANGTLKDRAQELDDIRPSPDLVMDYFMTDSVDVRVHGDAAVVTGIAEWRFTYRGQPSMNRRRYTAVYARGGPLRWRMVALHLGRAAGS
jgi:ketosteroid isomerase-like protein